MTSRENYENNQNRVMGKSKKFGSIQDVTRNEDEQEVKNENEENIEFNEEFTPRLKGVKRFKRKNTARRERNVTIEETCNDGDDE